MDDVKRGHMPGWVVPVATLLLAVNAVAVCSAEAPRPAGQSPQLSAEAVERLREGARTEQWGDPDFQRFHREVVGALSRQDAAAMALLTEFPLKVRTCDGASIAVENEAALQRRFDEAFPAWLRAEVVAGAKAGAGTTVWRGSETGLATGLIWTERVGPPQTSRYRVKVVNACQDAKKEPAPVQPRLAFTCETERHRVVVDGLGSDVVRYRAWNKPRFLPDPPDLTMRGSADELGTSGCAHSVWTFAQASTTITLEEVECSAGTDGPPDDARAQLVVSAEGQPQRMWWCY